MKKSTVATFALVVGSGLTILAAGQGGTTSEIAQAGQDTRCFELRTYYAAPGKLDALLARFRDHTVRLFAKHGIQNIGYWVPLDNPDNKLIYMLAFPSREARQAAWKAFSADPDWKKARSESEASGKLVTKIESVFLTATDYSPPIRPTTAPSPRVFELRTYTASAGNLDALNARFRDHTIRLFAKHGITSIGYWVLDKDQKDSDRTLIYILAHNSKEAAEKSFAAFRSDPEWIAAKEASEKKAGGPLTEGGSSGVKSVFLTPTDFSPMK